MKAVLRREKARNRSYHKLASLTYIQRAEARPKTMPAPPPPPGRQNRPGSAPPGPPGTVLVRAGGLRKMKTAAPSLRSAPTDA